MNVLWVTCIPSPYRVDFFNEFGKYCRLTVCFERHFSKEREVAWHNYEFNNFQALFLKGIPTGKDSAFSLEIISIFKREKPDFVFVSDYSTLTGMAFIEYMKYHNIPFIFEGDGMFRKNDVSIKNQIKKHFISSASYYFSSCNEMDKALAMYGANEGCIYRYPFTSISDADIVDSVISLDVKAKIKLELGISEDNVILSVGQFIYRKGFDVLIRAMNNIHRDVGVYFVGGIPTTEYIELKEKCGIDNVHFIGFKSKNDLNKYYMAADVFVLPTREDIWGLVINEAMSKGLPVITTTQCNAGSELVHNGLNGYLVESDNVDELCQAINSIFQQDLQQMGQSSIKIIKDYTIEMMAQCHFSILNDLCNG